MADVTGTDNAEALNGTAVDDIITGLGGGDALTGGGGRDTFRYLHASDSNAGGFDVITDFDSTSASPDVLDLSAVAPSTVSIISDGSSSFIFAVTRGGTIQIGIMGDFNPTAVETGNPDQGYFVMGIGSADDPVSFLYGGTGADTIFGTAGMNVITGGGGGDILYGGAGRDTFVINRIAGFTHFSAVDTLADFVSGTDRVYLDSPNITGVTVLRHGATSSVYVDSTGGFPQQIDVNAPIYGPALAGAFGNDIDQRDEQPPVVTIIADDLGDSIAAGLSSVTVIGGGGNDTIHGGRSPDKLLGGAGNDVIESGWNDLRIFNNPFTHLTSTVPGEFGGSILMGGDGDDTLTGGSDYFDGGSGNDSITLGTSNTAPGFGPGPPGGTAFGGDGNDTIRTYGGGSVIDGGAGDDRITMEPLFGPPVFFDGNNSGGVKATGGAGSDTFEFKSFLASSLVTPDTITDFATGTDHLVLPSSAGALFDYAIVRHGGGTLVFGVETQGGQTAHLQINSPGDINGRDLQGITHGIYMQGDDGADKLIASGFGDLIHGGGGKDDMTGGAGADVFHYAAASDSTLATNDVIRGFQTGIDKIDLRIVHTSPTDVFGIASDGTNDFVFVDLGGNGVNDMMIGVAGVTNMTLGDVLWG